MNEETIELRGLDGSLDKDGLEVKLEMYYDKERNNRILFTMYDGCGIDDVVNGISDKPYDYLIDTLNNNRNLVVDFSTIEYTTSDYIIYHGFDEEFVEESICPIMLMNELTKLRKADHSNYKNYKYQEWKGEYVQLKF